MILSIFSVSTFGALSQVSSLLEGLLKVTGHIEGSFWVFITLSVDQGLESSNRLLQGDELSWSGSEDFTHEEWLRQELLDLSGSGDGQLIFDGQFIHTQDGNDILEGLVVLEDLLDSSGGLVVLLTDNVGVQHLGSRIQWVDGWVDTQLSQGSGKHGSSIQMLESGGGGRIGKIIGWDVDGLDGSNGSLLGGGNSFLEGSQICREGGLISDGGWDTSEQGGHLRASLGESEDVVDEEKHVLSGLISEVLGNGESSQSDSGSSTWGLVHLSVDEGASAGWLVWLIDVDDTGLDHFVVEIVTLSGSLSDSGED